MKKLHSFIKQELQGWHCWEVLWLLTAISVIVALSIFWQDTLIGIISATTGVACVVCTGKGKLAAYIFGLINSVLYAYIAFQAAYYGETMLNALYYVPMQFVGFWVWAKNMNEQTGEVRKQHMKNRQRLMWSGIIAAATIFYGFVLRSWGDAMPFVDSFTTVSSVAAMIVSVGMYAEQWWIWVAVNVFSIIMWLKNFLAGNDHVATLLMWIVYLINAVIMLVKWEKEALEVKKNAV